MTKPPDDNDALRDGTLPHDPAADAEPMAPPELVPLGKLLDDAHDELTARADGTRRPLPLPWPSLARALGGGLWPGLHVVVGPTGGGKTQFALQIALGAAEHGIPVCYLALESSGLEFAARVLGLRDNRAWADYFMGAMGNAALDRAYQRHREAAGSWPLHVLIGKPGLDPRSITTHVATLRRMHDAPPLVVLDFLQLVGGDGAELRQRIGEAAYLARIAARDHGAVALVLSSTARENYDKLTGDAKGLKIGEGSPARYVGLGKESGEVEYAADTVQALCFEPWTPTPPPPGEGRAVHVAIAKQRAGPTSWVTLRWNGSRFFEFGS